MIRQASEIPNYTVGFSDELLESFRRFTAEANPAHLLPYLRPGLRVLDFGCGPGTISVGCQRPWCRASCMAWTWRSRRSTFARSLAETNGLNIATFHLGDVTDLPFDDGFFDVAHTQMGKDVKRHLLNAGFANIRITASFDIYSTPADVAFIHRVAQMWFLAPEIMERRSGTSLLAEICATPQPTPMTGGRNTPALMYGVAFGEAVANKPYHAGNADPQAKAE